MTNKPLTVKAAPGGLVPKEFNPRDHITDAETVDLPSTPYYRNLIREGSLVEADAETETVVAGETAADVVADTAVAEDIIPKATPRKTKPETQA